MDCGMGIEVRDGFGNKMSVEDVVKTTPCPACGGKLEIEDAEDYVDEAETMEITKQMFWAYEAVRVGGLTNMNNIRNVVELTELAGVCPLTGEQVMEIGRRYGELAQEFKRIDAK